MPEEEPYWLSRNPTEQQRLTRQHEVWTKSIGYLLHPSIAKSLPDNARIADIGCGTGIWMTEMAKVSPSTYQFDGYDISDAQFQSADSLPPNVSLHTDSDFKKPYPEELIGTYDLINIRLIIISMGEGVWESTLRNVLTLLKPRGAIQWVEGNFFVARGFRGTNATSSGGLTKGQQKLNGTLIERFRYNFPDWTKMYKDAGLEKVEEDVLSTDRLPEQRTDFTEIGIGAVFGGLKNLASTKAEGYWTEQEVEEYRQKAIEDMQSGAYLRWDLHVTIGFKTAN
ncbi:S-adenosyl-L-methionine-dependent methyltransferase [Clohesyomyces aquaticus]|uniref:S-adenosyl-L-methionine-dependent methyltransferase n=1 Tax=Clohesyomyces aquaticus TaxID=1231657 RepID=A0A1Y1ZEY0_9PLEO|nr:S-adenosyl-L-methionine-dependent methyltransferase [Clohesyomyces aquaticus]